MEKNSSSHKNPQHSFTFVFSIKIFVWNWDDDKKKLRIKKSKPEFKTSKEFAFFTSHPIPFWIGGGEGKPGEQTTEIYLNRGFRSCVSSIFSPEWKNKNKWEKKLSENVD